MTEQNVSWRLLHNRCEEFELSIIVTFLDNIALLDVHGNLGGHAATGTVQSDSKIYVGEASSSKFST